MKFIKTIFTLCITATLFLGLAYAWQQGLFEKATQQAIDQTVHTINQVEKQVFAPSPLRGPLSFKETVLTVDGVFTSTNKARTENGQKTLTRNATLDKAAAAKVNDMFAQQYFEHENPQGKGPADVVTAAGYAYITVGENLALGNFDSDAALVEAWMNSPGHRANILNPDFREIGIAVKKGTFEGRTTWLAVQEFGTPQTVCTEPKSATLATIEANKKKAATLKAELDSTEPETQEEVDAYNQKVDAYNTLINQTKALADTYNTQVNTYNGCLKSFTDKE